MADLNKERKTRRDAGRAPLTAGPDPRGRGSESARGRARSGPQGQEDAALQTRAEALYDRFAERSRELFEAS